MSLPTRSEVTLEISTISDLADAYDDLAYMVAVTSAGSSAEVPAPSGDVYEYFDTFRERFDRTTGERARGNEEARPADMPTESSWIIFDQADRSRLPGWVFRNRETI